MRPFESFEEFEQTHEEYEDIFLLRLCIKKEKKRKHWWSFKKETETYPYYELVPIKVQCLCTGIRMVDVFYPIDNSHYRVPATYLYHYENRINP